MYTFFRVVFGSPLMFGWRPQIEGTEYVPKSGDGVILAGNHLSVADELFLGATISRQLTFWAKSNYFTGKGISGWFTRNLVTVLGAIPVERRGGRAALTALDGAIPVLRSGGAVVVYPEGTRSPDGRLYRGHTGVARLAVATGMPIIPVGMIGTDKVLPVGHIVPKFSPRTVTVKFGKPIEIHGYGDDGSSLRALTDHVMSEIQKLTGQEYISRYAPTKAN